MDTSSDPLLPQDLHGAIPRDSYHLVYMIFYLLGLGSLSPWNFFITASEYFKFKLRNTTLPADTDYLAPQYQTELQTMFESYLTIASTIPNLLFNFITALLVKKCRRVWWHILFALSMYPSVDAVKKISVKTRMTSSLSLTIVMFAITVILARVNTDNWQSNFFAVTLVTVVIVNVASSVLCASLFGLASLFPSQYMQAAMMGQAMGGIFASVANIIALAAGSQVLDSGFWFFVAATVTAVLTLAAYGLLYYLHYSKYHIFEIGNMVISSSDPIHDLPDKPLHGVNYYCNILHKIWMEGLSVCLVFFVTLSCFPAIASSIISMEKGVDLWSEKFFSALVCFLLFNCGDWGGRSIAGSLQLPHYKHPKYLLVLVLLRVVFIPLLMMCNAVPRHTGVVFDSDVYPVIFILLLGLTNGYLGTLAMMYGPRKVTSKYAESTGAIMSVCLTTGLVSGSLFSLLLMKSL